MPAHKVVVGTVIEPPIGMGIMQRSVLAKTFPVVAALNAVHHAVTAVIRAEDNVAVLVKIHPPFVAAAFQEKFKPAGKGMVTPNSLLKFDPANIGGDTTALAAVQPSVRPPSERVGHRGGILHSESSQQNFRVGVWNI